MHDEAPPGPDKASPGSTAGSRQPATPAASRPEKASPGSSGPDGQRPTPAALRPAVAAPGDAGLASLAAVFFDMDGLLVETEEQWFAVETEVMARLGAEWGPEHQEALVGGPLEHSVAYMLRVAQSSVSPETMSAWILEAMERRLRMGVTWRPGAQRLLEELAGRGVPCALVSSSYRSIMDPVLDAVGRRNFATTISADDVTRTKPHADPYLLAARRLRVDPRRCVVLEDSVPGLLAAEAAGCVAVGVPNVIPLPESPGRILVESLELLTPAVLDGFVRDRHVP